MILVSSFTLGTSTGRWSTRFNVCEPLVDKNKREKKKKRGIVWKVLIVGNGNPIPMTHYLPLLPQRRSRNPTMSLRFAISSSIFYFFFPLCYMPQSFKKGIGQVLNDKWLDWFIQEKYKTHLLNVHRFHIHAGQYIWLGTKYKQTKVGPKQYETMRG